MVDPVGTKFRQVIVMGGNVFKLRGSPNQERAYLTTKLLKKFNNGLS